MTNVVGILVIILVLTILGVDEAVSRISEQLSEEDQVARAVRPRGEGRPRPRLG